MALRGRTTRITCALAGAKAPRRRLVNAPRYVAFHESILPVKQEAGFARHFADFCKHYDEKYAATTF